MHDKDSTFKRSLCAVVMLAVALAQHQAHALDPPGQGQGLPSLDPLRDSLDILVKTVDVDPIAGKLVSFSLERGLILEQDGTGERRRVAAEDLVQITTLSEMSMPSAGMATVTLSGSDRLIGTAVGFSNDRVAMEITSLGLVQVPLERITTWLTPQANDKSWHSAVASMLSQPSPGTDRLLLTNGDQIDGIITAIDGAAFSIETSLGISTIAHDRVVAAAILSAPPAGDEGLGAQIHLIDGSRVTTDRMSWTPSSVSAAIFDQENHQIPTKRIVRVDVLGGRWRWLADLTPLSAEHTPMMSVHWPFFRNRNVCGGPLRVAGRFFEQGLGVHSRYLLTFDLREEYSELITYYGMDDDSGPLADVTISIRVDGRVLHKKDSVRRGTLFGPLRINLNHAKRVELIVDFGKLGSIQDRFNWIEPALIR